jgi:putative restriction endonuclease
VTEQTLKGVFDTKRGSGYDDDRPRQYHFPKQYRSIAEALIGSWIVYREPQRNAGRRAYVAVARVTAVEDDPHRKAHAYAYVSDYLEFPHLVPFISAGRYAETALRAIADSAKVGVYLRGRSIRKLSDEDFAQIVRAGLGNVLATGNAVRLELDEQHTDYETQGLLQAPVQEQERRIEQILLNRKIRDAAFRSQVCDAYDNRCAITGLRILNGSGKPEAQAAHIWAVSDGGPDVVQNGIALSGTIHWLFDRHLISLTDDYRILLSHNKVPAQLRFLFESQMNRIHLPMDERLWPHPAYIAKHRERFVSG